MKSADHPVLIVGAGPTGLVLAIELARRGVPFRLIDRRPEPMLWDRATVMKARSLEVFDTWGIAERFLERGRIVHGAALFSGREQVAAVEFGCLDSRFPFFLSVTEDQTELVLSERLAELGGQIERGLEFVGLEQNAGAVEVRLRSLAGDELKVIASWVVGTDGFHSAVREAIGDAYLGHDNASLWAVMDVHFSRWSLPDNYAVLQLGPFNLNPLPLHDGRWRVYFRPSSKTDDVVARVNQALDEVSPGASVDGHDEAHFFHTHFRVAERYRMGRVLLSGDSAHTCSPIGGHGMNTGIQDAHNLGWKLAWVVQGQAPETLLDSYEPERRPVAEVVGQAGDEMEARGTRQDPVETEALIAFLASPEGHSQAVVEEMETGFGYGQSPIVEQQLSAEIQASTEIGARVGEAAGMIWQRREWRLADLVGRPKHSLFLMLGEADANAIQSGLELVRSIHAVFGEEIEVHAVTRNMAGIPDQAEELMHDPAGTLHDRLGTLRPNLCLLRPDGHLGFRAEPPSLDALQGYLQRILGDS